MLQMQPQVCQKKNIQRYSKTKKRGNFFQVFLHLFFIFLSLYRMVKNVETLKSRNHNTLQF